MKILEIPKALFKRKNLTKAERNYRSKSRWIHIMGGIYFFFMSSTIFNEITKQRWLFLGFHLFLLIGLIIAWFYFGIQFLKSEKAIINRKTQLAEEWYNLDHNIDMRQLSLPAKVTFIESVIEQQDDQLTQCIEGLLEHYEKTKP